MSELEEKSWYGMYLNLSSDIDVCDLDKVISIKYLASFVFIYLLHI